MEMQVTAQQQTNAQLWATKRSGEHKIATTAQPTTQQLENALLEHLHLLEQRSSLPEILRGPLHEYEELQRELASGIRYGVVIDHHEYDVLRGTFSKTRSKLIDLCIDGKLFQ